MAQREFSGVEINVEFTEAGTKSNLVSGENISTSLGKIMKFYNETENDFADIKGYIGYTSDDIYGIEADFENSTYTRIAGSVGKTAGSDFDNLGCWNRRRCNLTNEGVVVAYYGDAGYTETGALTQAITIGATTYPIGTLVQVMVEQPKFYYKVVPLKLEPNDADEIDTLTISTAAVASSNITITLDGVATAVAVTSGDTVNEVVDKIVATTFTDWTVTANSNRTAAIFTKTATGAVSAPVYVNGSTGVTGTFTRTQCGYTGKGYKLRKARYYVSATYKEGFKVHPAFIKNSVEVDKVYLSAYEACAYDTSASAYITDDSQTVDFTATTGDVLSSIAGAKPISGDTQSLTRANARIIAANRGTNWSQPYPAMMAVTQMLFIIEYCAFNSQSALGRGVVDKGRNDGSENTGATSTFGNASGTASGVDGLVSITYRGEENLWGNMSALIDGVTIKCDIGNSIHDIYIADHDFVDNRTTSSYTNTGITLTTRNGYISAMAYNRDYDWLFLPSESKGNATYPIGDAAVQASQNSGFRIYAGSGTWNSGHYAGVFYSVNNLSSGSKGDTYGCRIIYFPTS